MNLIYLDIPGGTDITEAISEAVAMRKTLQKILSQKDREKLVVVVIFNGVALAVGERIIQEELINYYHQTIQRIDD